MIALRVSILIAAALGAFLHYALGVHSNLEGWKWLNHRFVADALNDPSFFWLAAPYILLAIGMAFGKVRSLWTVLFSIVAVALVHVYMYSSPNQDRGLYVVLSPILLIA